MVRRITLFMDSLPVGGAERHGLHLARALNARGYDVSLLVYSGIRSSNFDDAEMPARTTVLGRGSNNTDIEGWRLAGDAIARFDPEIVIAVNQATLSAAVLARLLGKFKAPIVCLFHTTKIATTRGRVRLPLFYLFLSFCEGMIFVSRNQARYWLQRAIPAKTCAVIVNGVDMDFFGEATPEARIAARRSLGLSDGDFVVGISAQFRPEKNHAQLVRVAARLRDLCLPIRLVFVGDGIQRAATEALVKTVGLADRAHFAGEQRDVRPYLAAFDVGVICSRSIETMSLSAIETLATGTPMVMSDIGGASEIIDVGANGHLFAEGDDDALVECLVKLADPDVREPMRRNARRIAVERFAYQRMVEEYDRYFQSFPNIVSDGSLTGHPK